MSLDSTSRNVNVLMGAPPESSTYNNITELIKNISISTNLSTISGGVTSDNVDLTITDGKLNIAVAPVTLAVTQDLTLSNTTYPDGTIKNYTIGLTSSAPQTITGVDGVTVANIGGAYTVSLTPNFFSGSNGISVVQSPSGVVVSTNNLVTAGQFISVTGNGPYQISSTAPVATYPQNVVFVSPSWTQSTASPLFTSISAAVTSLPNGGTCIVYPGSYTENIVLSGVKIFSFAKLYSY